MSSRTLPVTLASLTALGALACTKTEDRRTDERLTLALAPPPPSADSEALAKLITSASKAGDRATPWIVLGEAWVKHARASADPGYYLAADACATLALERAPEDNAAWNLRGMVLLDAHRFAEARDLAKARLEKEPANPRALGILSDALLELGEYEAAAAAADAMMDKKPNLPSYARVAHLAWLHGDVEKAKAAYRAAFDAGRGQKDTEPEAWILSEAARVSASEGNLRGADQGYDLALQLFPDYPGALAGKGRVALSRGDAKAAVGWLERAFERSPLADTALTLARARRVAGDEAGAERAFADVRRIGRQTDHRTLARYLMDEGQDPAEALRLLETEKRTRGGIYGEDLEAWALYRAGRVEDALAASRRALRLGTPDASLWYHDGVIRLAAGDREGGRRSLERALALDPTFDLESARDARRRLEEKAEASARRE